MRNILTITLIFFGLTGLAQTSPIGPESVSTERIRAYTDTLEIDSTVVFNNDVYLGAKVSDSIAATRGYVDAEITGLGTMATQNATSVNIDGGQIDGTTIGGSTAAAGSFTNIDITGNISNSSGDVVINDNLVINDDFDATIGDDVISDANASGAGSVYGGATGGAQGAGTINAKGIFVDGTAVNTISFGTTQQIPFMNVGGTDFNYESDFDYNSTTNTLSIGPGGGASPILGLDDQEISFNGSVFDIGYSGAGNSYQRLRVTSSDLAASTARGGAVFMYGDGYSADGAEYRSSIVIIAGDDVSGNGGRIYFQQDDSVRAYIERDGNWDYQGYNVTGVGVFSMNTTSDEALRVESITVTSSQILNSSTSPVELIAAPGAGNYIKVLDITFSMDFNSAAYATPGSPSIRYSGGQSITPNLASFDSFVTSSADIAHANGPTLAVDLGINEALQFYGGTSDPTTGDSDIKIKIWYTIESI